MVARATASAPLPRPYSRMKAAIVQCDPPPIIRSKHRHGKGRAGKQRRRDPIPPPATEKIEPPGADLNHAQHRAEGDGLRRRQALRLQKLDQHGAESEGDERIERNRRHDQVECAFLHDGGSLADSAAATGFICRFGSTRQSESVERKAHKQQHPGIDQTGSAPAHRVRQKRRGGPKNTAGKPGHQHHERRCALFALRPAISLSMM